MFQTQASNRIRPNFWKATHPIQVKDSTKCSFTPVVHIGHGSKFVLVFDIDANLRLRVSHESKLMLGCFTFVRASVYVSRIEPHECLCLLHSSKLVFACLTEMQACWCVCVDLDPN